MLANIAVVEVFHFNIFQSFWTVVVAVRFDVIGTFSLKFSVLIKQSFGGHKKQLLFLLFLSP